MALTLTAVEQAMLDGAQGPGVAMAMRVVTGLGRVRGATRLVEIASAHIDGCLYHGWVGLDFAERLRDLGARVVVPTTLNVGSLDLLHPGLVRGDTAEQREVRTAGRALMDAYVALGARPTWTCAPYQLDARPAFGEHVAWAESNAIAFCNSVLGARTDRYGDFLDICAAVTGRAPYAGLHTDGARRGDVLVDCSAIPDRVLRLDLAMPLLGYLVGSLVGTRNPVLVGLPEDVGEDGLKAFGAAAASSGGVAMFHVVGVTPEAPDLESAFGATEPVERIGLGTDDLVRARHELTTAESGRLDVVSVGTPHASLDEIATLARLLEGGPPIAPSVDWYLSTGRSVLAEAERLGHVRALEESGIRIVVDTCTYVTSILPPGARVAMTNSGKWAHYAPGTSGSTWSSEASRSASNPPGREGCSSMTRSCADPPSGMPLTAVPLHGGSARGAVLHLDAPLSFWGGTDHDGLVIDAHHPQHGWSVSGRVLVMTAGRGSSSSSYVLAEQLRRGTGPAAIVLGEADAIIVLGSIVADELYGIVTPVVQVARGDLSALPSGLVVSVGADVERGWARVTADPSGVERS